MSAAAAVTAIMVALLAAWFSNRLAEPIIQASGVAERITEGSLDNPVLIEGNDESAGLLRALDAMRACDLVLLVAQYGSTRRKVIREAVKTLNRTGTPIAGAVLNQVDIERDHYYYSRYYNYYRYGYYGDQVPPKAKTSSASKPKGKAG